jgi:broad specificity phosphatase PhoE
MGIFTNKSKRVRNIEPPPRPKLTREQAAQARFEQAGGWGHDPNAEGPSEGEARRAGAVALAQAVEQQDAARRVQREAELALVDRRHVIGP